MQLPLAELAGQFYGSLKACTSGYATFDYEEGPYRSADLVRLDFLVHGSPVDALTRVLHRSDAVTAGRAVCQKLVSVVSKQAFEVWAAKKPCASLRVPLHSSAAHDNRCALLSCGR